MFQTLYLCYFGLREPLVQTQVLPYLRELKKMDGLKISLLTFEPNFKKNWSAGEIYAEKQNLASEGIDWHALPYHKRPTVPATLYDILNGARLIRKLVRREGINILHARIHVPALMGAIVKKLSGGKVKMIFDIRGFAPEEYTDAGIWKENGWLYKSIKKVEKRLFRDSDAFVVLTEKAREILFPESRESGEDKFGRPVEVIPCCVDLERFKTANEDSRREIRARHNLENRRVIVYIGSFGGWYLTDEMLEFLETAREQNPRTFTLILTQRDKEKVIENLRKRGFCDEDFLVESVAPSEIPKFLSASDVAVSFIKKCYSKQASSPTKIAEYLACGLPVISNAGIGDLDKIIENERVGVIIDRLQREDYLKTLQEIELMCQDKKLSEHCRQTARKLFDLEEVGGTKYRNIYKKVMGRILAGFNGKDG